MALALSRPAPVLALAEMLAEDARAHSIDPFLAARMVNSPGEAGQKAKSYGVIDERGDCLACWGLAPVGPRELFLWFEATSGLAPRLLEALRLTQLTLPYAAENALVTACVAPGHKPGEKIARWLGLSPDPRRPAVWTIDLRAPIR
ncbi:MAG: hypothetical protein ACR650_09755 [Methylocystis sp.]